MVPRRSRYSHTETQLTDHNEVASARVPALAPRTNLVPSPPSVVSQHGLSQVPTPQALETGPFAHLPPPSSAPVSSTFPASSSQAQDNSSQPASTIKPELKEGGLWFNMRPVTNKIRESIQVHFEGPYLNWRTTPQEQFFTWDPSLASRARSKFNRGAAKRLKNLVYRVSKKTAHEVWTGANVHKALLEKRKDPAFVERSERAKRNKRSGVPDGEKVDPGHRQGPISTYEIIDKMTNENDGKVPNAFDVYNRGHSVKRDDGSRVLVGKKAEEIQARYNEVLETAADTDEPITPSEAFWDVVGGRKSGVVPGLGSGSDTFYGAGPSRGSSKAYTPGFISQLQGQVEQVKFDCEQRVASLTETYERRLAVQEENQRRIEEYMLKMMDVVKERCGDLFPSDLFPPQGPDPDGASGSFPARPPIV